MISVILLFCFVSTATAELWPFEVGQTWIYQETDPSNNTYTLSFTVDAIVSLDSSAFGIFENEDYFHLIGDYEGFHDTYVRSTETSVYGWSGGLDGDRIMHDITISHWTGESEQYWYNGTVDNIVVPYGGPFTAHEFEGNDIPADPGHHWNNYYVQDVGLVLDTSTNGYRVVLVDIVPTPVPGAIILLGSGLIGLAGVSRKKT